MTKGMMVAEIGELELRLGGGDYHLEAVLTRTNRLGNILRNGRRKQKRWAINLLLDKILVGPETKITGSETLSWPKISSVKIPVHSHPV
jgi:hypothetical protein